MPKRYIPLFVALFLTAANALPAPVAAQEIQLVRDAEVENIIRAYTAPVFEAAGFGSGEIVIHLVDSNQLNAFVAGGLNIFVNTGLLMRAEEPGQIIGVIAHETGHITGGHLARIQDAVRAAQTQGYISMLIAAAAAIVARRGDVGIAAATGGAQVVQAGLLKYSRNQEAAADQAALDFLDRAGISARGLARFLEILEGQELLVSSRQDPYLRTHPVTQERISNVLHHVETSPVSNARLPPNFDELQRRMHAKLAGFLLPRTQVFRRYKESDGSLESRYARAIVYFRKPDMDRALPLIDGLIAERPKDPYFHELKGQMLFENGRIREAVGPYEEAVRLLPYEGLFRAALAQVQLELHDPVFNKAALVHLQEARRLDPRNVFTWRLLAIAYGRNGQMGHTALSLAEFALATGERGEARAQAERAFNMLAAGDPARHRASDIILQTERPKE